MGRRSSKKSPLPTSPEREEENSLSLTLSEREGTRKKNMNPVFSLDRLKKL